MLASPGNITGGPDQINVAPELFAEHVDQRHTARVGASWPEIDIPQRARIDRWYIIAAHGGRYIIRGAPLDHVEGKLPFKRLVVLEFPSVEAARGFYNSPEYQPVKKLRTDSATSDIAIVDGYAG